MPNHVDKAAVISDIMPALHSWAATELGSNAQSILAYMVYLTTVRVVNKWSKSKCRPTVRSVYLYILRLDNLFVPNCLVIAAPVSMGA